MSERAFFEAEARTRAVEAVQEIERQTAAEVVVALRKSSGSYRHADYLFGFLLAVALLVAIVLMPQPMSPLSLPVDAAVAFALGALVCARFPSLRRLLSRRALLRSNVATSARAAFVDLGVSRTTGRWGVLVYLSMLERDAEVVADVGIDTGALGEEWTRAVEELRAAARVPDLHRFVMALRSLGPILGRAHARRDDDVNELPDEVSAS